MVKEMLGYAKGHVRIRVTGHSYERFLNLCARNRIILWKIEPVDGSYEMNLSIKDFRTLRPLARKSGARVRIVSRYGLPFFLHRHRRRKMLLGGMLTGAALLFLLSCFIWDIDIRGNQARTDDIIFDFLNEAGIKHGMLKSGIDCKGLAAKLRGEFDDFIWVAVKIEGTRLLVDVQENTDLELEEGIDYGPSDLVSNVEGTVKEIITRAGTPLVKAGDQVKIGQPLVLGQVEILDDAGEVVNYQYMAADADIYIETRRSYHQSFPMKYIKKEYTGRMKKGVYLEAFGTGFAFSLPGGYERSDWMSSGQKLRLFRSFYLPLVWGKICEREYRLTEKSYTKEEAVRKAESNLDKFLCEMEEKGVQILQNNVKIEAGVKNCTAEGTLVFLERAGKRVERSLGQ